MKIGDKYLCIKDRILRSNLKIINNKGKIYEIINIEKDNLDFDVVTISNDSKCQTYFYSIVHKDHLYYFYDYFIDIKSLRKEKLQLLNEQIRFQNSTK